MASPTEATPLPHGALETGYHLVIDSARGRAPIDFRELWHYRDLLYFLTRREISIRYKQTALGVAWAVLQPLLAMVVFTVFGKLAKVPSDGVPSPVFIYLGLLPWTYFSNALTRSGTSLVSNSNLLSKVYFPRILIPLSATLSALVDFAVAFVVLLVLMASYRVMPGAQALYLVPLLTLLTAFVATGIGMGLAALNVQYRDVQHAVPFLMQLWMFATPSFYPTSLVPEKYQGLFQLNPMTGVVEAFRAAMLGRPVDFMGLAVALGVGTVAFAAGLWQFRRLERVFADVI